MCGRYTLRAKLNLLLDEFAAEMADGLEWDPRYNIPPTASVPAIRLTEGKRELVKLKWGLIPSWSKDAKIAFSTINARADTVATKPAFRTAYKKRRCLIPADGYFEWLREGKEKKPYYYEVDGVVAFAFAGLWEWWGGPEGENKPVETFTIITTEANELCQQIHDRMPVIVHPEDYDSWLACEDIPLVPFPPDRMLVYPVSQYVNNVKNQGEQCIKAI